MRAFSRERPPYGPPASDDEPDESRADHRQVGRQDRVERLGGLGDRPLRPRVVETDHLPGGVDAAIGAVLETLSIEPDLLEVPPTH